MPNGVLQHCCTCLGCVPCLISCPVAGDLHSPGALGILSNKHQTESRLEKGRILFFKDLNNQVIIKGGGSFQASETPRTRCLNTPSTSALSLPLSFLSVRPLFTTASLSLSPTFSYCRLASCRHWGSLTVGSFS